MTEVRSQRPADRRKSALIIVDVQNDFVSGSLAVPGGRGKEVVEACNRLRHHALFDTVVVTQDWHPPDHISFADNAKNYVLSPEHKEKDIFHFTVVSFSSPPVDEQILYPVHCVEGTWGAELHPDLETCCDDVIIRKGMHPERESYSAFNDNKRHQDTMLNGELARRGVTDVYVCGLVYDICVGWTARDAVKRGYKTFIVEDATCGTDTEGVSAMKTELSELGVKIIKTNEVVLSMSQGN